MNNNEIEPAEMGTKRSPEGQTDLEDFGGERSLTPTFANEREEQESWFETYTFKKDLDVPKEWECDLCNKSFTQAGNLKRHKRIVHEGRKGYECDICKKTYREVQSLKVHIKCVHEGIREYQCAFCDKLCSTKSSLKTHVINNHATVPIKKRDTKIACRICGIVFCHSGNLKRHVRTVHEDKSDFRCDICRKDFKSYQSMKIHKHCVHDGRRDYVCSECGREMSTKSGLRLHVRKAHPTADFLAVINSSTDTLALDLSDDVKTEFMETDDHDHASHAKMMQFYPADSQIEVKSEYIEEIEPHVEPRVMLSIKVDTIDGDVNSVPKVEHNRNCVRNDESFSDPSQPVMPTGTVRWTCVLCNKNFTQSGNLKRHLRNIHLGTPRTNKEPEDKKPEVNSEPEASKLEVQITPKPAQSAESPSTPILSLSKVLPKLALPHTVKNNLLLIPVKIVPVKILGRTGLITVKNTKPQQLPDDDFFVGN